MSAEKKPITIKKYANRRLYNTGTSSYVTLDDLAEMVKKGEDFEVFDAKSGDDITRSVLAQIIFEQEGKAGENLLPIAFLRQLIRFYGDSMQSLVPRYLEFSIDQLTSEQQKFRDQMTKAFGQTPFGPQSFGSMEDMTRKNMQMFMQAFTLFNPFGQKQGADASGDGAAPQAKDAMASSELGDLKRELEVMRRKIDKLSET